MILEDIAQYIESEDVATLGTDMFLGELPLNKTECIALMYGISPDPHKTFDLFEQHIDVWSRHSHSDTGYKKMLEILRLFHRKHHYNTEKHHIYYSNVVGIIEDMDRDSERRKMYKLTVRFIYRPLG